MKACAILFIESDLVSELSFKKIIEQFASAKSRRTLLK